MVGAAGANERTVSVAEWEVADPLALVRTASTSSPDCPTVTLLKVRVGDVAPGIGLKVAPLSVEANHCTVAFPSLDSSANVAEEPSSTVWLTGL
jgi:hypothetical protein